MKKAVEAKARKIGMAKAEGRRKKKKLEKKEKKRQRRRKKRGNQRKNVRWR